MMKAKRAFNDVNEIQARLGGKDPSLEDEFMQQSQQRNKSNVVVHSDQLIPEIQRAQPDAEQTECDKK